MKKCINKRISSAFLALLVLLLAVGVCFGCFYEKDGFFLEKYANADAKFYGNHIITSVDETIYMLDLKGNVVKTYEGLKASWMYADAEEGLVVYSNHDQETHLLRLDDEMNLVSDEVIIGSELLAIDPTICKVGDRYLVTHTTIEGTINNSSPDGENGLYSLELFSSDDLKQWEHCGTIVSEKHDIEDIDMVYEDGKLYCMYEKEEYDKGPSKICLQISEDEGMSWSGEKVLIENGGDNEPACLWKEDEGWRLFFSSDQECPGKSYNGASAYMRCFNEQFQYVEGSEKKLKMRDNRGVRFYEAAQIGEKCYVMYAHNYMTDKDFVVKTIK